MIERSRLLVILCDHIKSLDLEARRATRACIAPAEVVAETLAKLATLVT